MPRMREILVLMLALASASCASSGQRPDWCSVAAVRSDAEAVLAAYTRATIAEDIDAYMALTPETLAIDDTSGVTIDRDELRANVLRDWAVIVETLALEQSIESVVLNGCGTAELIVDQRWERTMLRPNGATGTDRILTTQRHRETWRHTAQGWRGFEIEELGGDIFVNGERYTPQ